MLHLRGENGQKQGMEALWQQNHVLKLLHYAGGKAELSVWYNSRRTKSRWKISTTSRRHHLITLNSVLTPFKNCKANRTVLGRHSSMLANEQRCSEADKLKTEQKKPSRLKYANSTRSRLKRVWCELVLLFLFLFSN